MLVATSVVADARVLREAVTLVEEGHQVHVVGKDVPAGSAQPSGVRVSTATAGSGLRPASAISGPVASTLPHRFGRYLLLPEHRNLSFARWSQNAGAVATGLTFDVVHAHDFTALALGSRLAKQRGVPLVYDAHELWSARHRSGRPTPAQNFRERRAERRLGSGAAAVLTVGEALATRLRSAYGWDHVTVVRNTFPRRPADVVARPTTPTAPTAAIYAGRVGAGRDLTTVAAASRLLSMPVELLGPVDQAFVGRFDRGRCALRPPVAPDEVDAALRTAGLALVTLSDGPANHRVALPNKLFHAVRAGTPVVASDVGELARTVRERGIGVLYRPGEPASLVAAVEEARDRYAVLAAAVGESAAELSWDADRDALLRVYAGLAR